MSKDKELEFLVTIGTKQGKITATSGICAIYKMLVRMHGTDPPDSKNKSALRWANSPPSLLPEIKFNSTTVKGRTTEEYEKAMYLRLLGLQGADKLMEGFEQAYRDGKCKKVQQLLPRLKRRGLFPRSRLYQTWWRTGEPSIQE